MIKSTIFSRKTANQNPAKTGGKPSKTQGKSLKNSRRSHKNHKSNLNPAKTLRRSCKKIKILTQKLPATEARCLAVPPICVEKKA